jgi:hypothetical protein
MPAVYRFPEKHVRTTRAGCVRRAGPGLVVSGRTRGRIAAEAVRFSADEDLKKFLHFGFVKNSGI